MLETCPQSLTFKEADDYTLPRVKHFYKQQGMRAQAPKGERIFIASQQGQLLAALRLQALNDVYLLRSMCVAKDYRQQGIGSALLQHIQAQLDKIECYSFPYVHLVNFYSQASFTEIDVSDSPQQVQDKFQRYINSGRKLAIMKHQSSAMLK